MRGRGSDKRLALSWRGSTPASTAKVSLCCNPARQNKKERMNLDRARRAVAWRRQWPPHHIGRRTVTEALADCRGKGERDQIKATSGHEAAKSPCLGFASYNEDDGARV